MDAKKTAAFIENFWDDSILPALSDFIRIPNKSPAFDPEWDSNGHMDKAVELLEAWCRAQPIEGMQVEVVRLEGRTPLFFIEINGAIEETVLLYGHLDKQPEMVGWDEDLDPWKPVIKNDRLYGRGGADDGYAVFSSLAAVRALQMQGIPHPRCVVLIEASEESGSPDLPAYFSHLADRIGSPDLVICLDAECGSYDRLWCSTSLRGMVSGVLSVEILTEGVHSGTASGIVPSSFRIARQLLSRIENEETGEMILSDLKVDTPEIRKEQTQVMASVLEEGVFNEMPFAKGAGPMADDPLQCLLNRTWRSTLSVIGTSGLPPVSEAGNVLRPKTELFISIRIPPRCDADRACKAVQRTLESDPPYGARVSFTPKAVADGWDAPEQSGWLTKALDSASNAYFGEGPVYMGMGGTIPLLAMLSAQFPKAQFVVTGVLGPHSNAHGPNEFLHIPTAKKLTACIAEVLGRAGS